MCCRGMTVTSGVVSIKKDSTNLIGISIGGGAPLCPCLYIVQVLTNTGIIIIIIRLSVLQEKLQYLVCCCINVQLDGW